MKRNILKLAALLIVGAFILTGCGNDGQEEGKKIKIGMNNWAENIAASNMWKILLEEKGYEVELVDVGKSILYSSVAEGDLDIGMEVWIPDTDKVFIDEYGDRFDIQEEWYKNTGLGLVVPSYLDINSIEELNENKEIFNKRIAGIDSGASLMDFTKIAIEEYGLDFELVDSSESIMLASLEDAYSHKEPIVVTLWNPHWVFAEYDLKYLEDPKNVFGDGDDIVFITRKGFDEDFPEVLEWMNKWFMTDETLGEIMAIIEEVNDPVQGASIWIEENRDLINEWISQ